MTPLDFTNEAVTLHEKLCRIAYGTKSNGRRAHALRLTVTTWRRALRRAHAAGIYDMDITPPNTVISAQPAYFDTCNP